MLDRLMAPLRAVVVGFLVVLAVAATGCAARSTGAGEAPSADERIHAAVLQELAEVDELVLDDLILEVANGVVTLSGVQPALEPVSEALRRAAAVRGVQEVVNRVRIRRAPTG